ncbi:MAG: PAS domain-containing protein [Rhodospirillales bacterium]
MPEIRFKQFRLSDHPFPDLSETCRYWSEKKQSSGGIAPSWSDIDLLDLPSELLPKICVVDVALNPLNFTYRYWGTAITGLHHYDLSGKTVRQLTPPDYAQCIWDQYNVVYTSGIPQTFLTEIPLEEGYNTFYIALRLPLSSDGVKIDKILAAEAFGNERDQLRTLFETLA